MQQEKDIICMFLFNSGSTVIQAWHFLGMNLKVFAVNYNVLRIMSGMGGLAYSN